MDLEPIHRGVYNLMVAAATTLTSVIPLNTATLPQSTFHQPPQIIQTQLNMVNDKSDEQLVMVTSSRADIVPITEQSTAGAKIAGPVLPTPKPIPKETPANPSFGGKDEASGGATISQAVEEVKTTISSMAESLMKMVNDHRASIGKSAFEKDGRLCSVAESRLPQLQNEIFGSGAMHAGLKAMNLPYWNTENIAGYSTVEQIYNFWMTDFIHRKAIESDNKYTCAACANNVCAEEFSNFEAK
jgi:uncharacterized protein YkwD